MKKIILLISAIAIIIGCELSPEIEEIHYLSNSEYNTLLINLGTESYIDKNVIDTHFDNMGVSKSYEYSYYNSGNYKCYTFNWNKWDKGWVYYVDVDIWTENNILKKSMCSYYTD